MHCFFIQYILENVFQFEAGDNNEVNIEVINLICKNHQNMISDHSEDLFRRIIERSKNFYQLFFQGGVYLQEHKTYK